MTTRIILKRQLVKAADELARALESWLGKPVKYPEARGRAAEVALASGNFQILPLTIDSAPGEAFHIVFEPRGGNLEVIFRGDDWEAVLMVKEKFLRIKRPRSHSHVRISFSTEAADVLKAKLRDKRLPPQPASE